MKFTDLKKAFAKAVTHARVSWQTKKPGYMTIALGAGGTGAAGAMVYYGHQSPVTAALLLAESAVFAGAGFYIVRRYPSLTETPAGHSIIAGNMQVAGNKDQADDLRRVASVARYVELLTADYRKEGILPPKVEKRVRAAIDSVGDSISKLRAYAEDSDDRYEDPQKRAAEFVFSRKVTDSHGNDHRIVLARVAADALTPTPWMQKPPPYQPSTANNGSLTVDAMLDVDNLLNEGAALHIAASPPAETEDPAPSSARMRAARRLY